MYAETIIKELLQLLIPRFSYASPEERPLRMFFATELVKRPFRQGSFLQTHGRLDSLLSCMDKDHHLVSLGYKFCHLFEHDTIKIFARLDASRLASDSDEMLFEGNGSERRVEIEQPRVA
jgi:hypothetical protein